MSEPSPTEYCLSGVVVMEVVSVFRGTIAYAVKKHDMS